MRKGREGGRKRWNEEKEIGYGVRKIHRNREKNLQFNGVKQSKIRWTVVEIKFMKGEKFKIWQTKNQ